MAAGSEFPGYSNVQPIGHGGMGTVYAATDDRLGRRVALKVLNTTVDPSAHQLIVSEGRIAATLSGHPNVLSVYAVGQLPDGRMFLAMELAEGGSLADLGTLDVSTALRVGVKLAGALASLHYAGIVHRDVSPRNVLFNAYGEPMLTDFGVAVTMHISSEVSSAFTPMYAAPEVLTDQAASPAADVFSLAATLFSAVTGKLPRPSIGSMPAVIAADPREAVRAASALPETLAAALDAALAPDPSSRPSAREFGQLLQEAQVAQGLPVTEMLLGRSPSSLPRRGARSVEEEQAEILLQSVLASDRTVGRAARRVEDRRGRRIVASLAPMLTVAGVVATFLAAVVEKPGRALDALPIVLGVGVSIAASVVAATLARVAVLIRRRRSTSMAEQALELSARMRNAYLKELQVHRGSLVLGDITDWNATIQ